MDKEKIIMSMEASDELDALVAKEVMGWGIRISDGQLDWARSWRGERDWAGAGQVVCTDGPFANMQCPPFSRDILASWLVVDKMAELFPEAIIEVWVSKKHFTDGNKAHCLIWDGTGHLGKLYDKTTPEAICKTALLASLKRTSM